MKTVIVTAFGGPEVLEVRDVPAPEPADDEVLIKVHAAGINYADIMQRDGLYPGGPRPPFGAGFEVSGVVERAGSQITLWNAGDEVMSFCAGGYSDYVVAKEWQVMPKPEALSYAQAAAIPCQYLTAYHALLTLGQLESGQTVLIQAAAGGLGTQLVQIARNTGATVIGTASTPEKCALIESLGCHHPVNYTQEDFAEVVKSVTGGQGCDLIIESVGGDVFDKSLKCLRTRGMLVTLGVAGKQPPTVEAVKLLANNWTVAGFHLMAYTADTAAMASAIRDLHAWLMDDKLTVIVGHEFALEKAAEAHQFISDRKSSGKVVVLP